MTASEGNTGAGAPIEGGSAPSGGSPSDYTSHLKFMDLEARGSAAEISAALRSVSVPFFESDDETTGARISIVVFSSASPCVLRFIRERALGSDTLVLALSVPGAVQSEEHAWRLLEAGATDTFAWDHSSSPEREVKERLGRWVEVDKILHSRVVQENLVGSSPAWTRCLRQIIELAAFSQASALITGESGTGKELVARLIHTLDRRSRKKDLIVLDCTTVAPELSGSEFFGHEKGAFTGAAAVREGALKLADGGSLFLDEVGELPLRLQAELLRAVQERAYKKVGGNTWEKSDYRLICATHRDLLEEEAHGRFRRDFYFRIANCMCRLPSLDERREDIPALAARFMEVHRPGWEPRMDESVERYLKRRAYPGNVRDLKQLVARIVHRHVGDGPITVGDLPREELGAARIAGEESRDALFEASVAKALAIGTGLKDIGRIAEETAVRLAVQKAQGNLQLAAQELGVSDRALQLRRAQKANRDLRE